MNWKQKSLSLILAGVFMVATAVTAQAQLGEYPPAGFKQSIGDKEQAFIDTYISAVNSNDWEKFKTLMPQSVQACITKDVPRYNDVMTLTIPDTRQINFMRQKTDMLRVPLAEHGMKIPADVQVTSHVMSISYVDTAKSQGGMVANVGLSEVLLDVNDRYLLVLACPMTDAEKEAAAKRQKR